MWAFVPTETTHPSTDTVLLSLLSVHQYGSIAILFSTDRRAVHCIPPPARLQHQQKIISRSSTVLFFKMICQIIMHSCSASRRLGQLDRFMERYKLHNLTYEEIQNLNTPM